MSRPQPTQRPRTYLVDIGGKVYQRTREHLKPRTENAPIPTQVGSYILPNKPNITSDSIPSTGSMQHLLPAAMLSADDNVNEPAPSLPELENHPRLPPKSSPHKNLRSPVIAVKEKKLPGYQPKVQTTRAGRVTKLPDKFRD